MLTHKFQSGGKRYMLSWSVPAVTFFHLDTHHSFIYTSIARKQKADKYKKNQKYKVKHLPLI